MGTWLMRSLILVTHSATSRNEDAGINRKILQAKNQLNQKSHAQSKNKAYGQGRYEERNKSSRHPKSDRLYRVRFKKDRFIDFEHAGQRQRSFQRRDAVLFNALHRSDAYIAQFGEVLLRPTFVQTH